MLSIRESFIQHCKTSASLVVQSPGRINLIGEHIDYNHGFVLPAAIDKYIEVAIAKRLDGMVQMVALDIGETIIVPIHSLTPHATQWVNYIIGVLDQVIKHRPSATNIKEGFDICIQGNIPLGAGLSSSAALECAVLFALNELYQLSFSKMEMALMAQQAEHEFAGVKCGIMDMFASLYGQKNKAILLDCESLAYHYYPLDLNEYSIVLLDTQIKHTLASSEYNTRRLECEQGLALIQKKFPHLKTFRELSLQQLAEGLEAATISKSATLYKRCTYVVEEINRVQAAVKDLEQNDIISFGQKMFETHKGLSSLYEVSCPELDFLVEAVSDNENVMGARMMGGGFGGCTINIIKKTAVEKIVKLLQNKYEAVMQKQLGVYITSIEQGTRLVN